MFQKLPRNRPPRERTHHLHHPESLRIENIGRLVTMQPGRGREGPLGVIKNAAVRCIRGRITWFGADGTEPALPKGVDEVRLDADGGVVMPGLIDCHTHIVHGGYRQDEFAERARGKSYHAIMKEGRGIHSTVNATADWHFDALYEHGAARLDEALRHGVTTVEIKSGYGLSKEVELKILHVIAALSENHVINILPTFMGAHTVPLSFKKRREEYISKVIKEMIPIVGKEKLAYFCDVFVDDGAFKRDEAKKILLAGKRAGLVPRIHADQFNDGGGAQLAAEVGAASADHLEYISDAGIKALSRKKVTAVVLPGSTFFTGATRYAPARKMIQAGVNVAISTDYNPGTTPCLDLFLMATIAITQMGLSPEEALLGITLNAARAMKIDGEFGSITAGKVGDLLVLETDDEVMPLYRYGANFIRTVIRNGEVVWQHRGYNL